MSSTPPIPGRSTIFSPPESAATGSSASAAATASPSLGTRVRDIASQAISLVNPRESLARRLAALAELSVDEQIAGRIEICDELISRGDLLTAADVALDIPDPAPKMRHGLFAIFEAIGDGLSEAWAGGSREKKLDDISVALVDQKRYAEALDVLSRAKPTITRLLRSASLVDAYVEYDVENAIRCTTQNHRNLMLFCCISLANKRHFTQAIEIAQQIEDREHKEEAMDQIIHAMREWGLPVSRDTGLSMDAIRSALDGEARINFHQRPPKILVFKGGGPKGLAHIGAYQACETHITADGHSIMAGIKRVAGASAGAIMATFIAFGYTSDEILQYYAESPHAKEIISLNPLEMPKKHPGGELFAFVEEAIRAKTGIEYCSFGELRARHFTHLHVIVTDTAVPKKPYPAVQISSEDPKWDDLPVAEAVRASASLPGIFRPQVFLWKKSRADGSIYFCTTDGQDLGSDFAAAKEALYRPKARIEESYMDGGLADNYPLERFNLRRYTRDDIDWDDPFGDCSATNVRALGFDLVSASAEDASAAAAADRSSQRSFHKAAFIGLKSVSGDTSYFDKALARDPTLAERTVRLDIGELQLTSVNASPLEGEGKRVVESAFRTVSDFFASHADQAKESAGAASGAGAT